MNPLFSKLTAWWLVLYGLCGCIQLGVGVVERVDPLDEGMVLCVLGSPCLLEGALFFRRGTFSLFGQMLCLANGLWTAGMTSVYLAEDYDIFAEFKWILGGLGAVVFLLHVMSCLWIFRLRRRSERESS